MDLIFTSFKNLMLMLGFWLMNSSIISGLISSVTTILLLLLGYLVFFGRKFEKIDKLEKEQEKQDKKIDEFSTDIATLKEFKANTEKIIDKEIYKTKSPLDLTDFGKKLLADSGFNTIFEQEKDNLVTMLEKKDPKTQYDVQEMARLLMSGFIDYAPFTPLKTYAFTNGKDFAQILRAGAIPLRDYYLEKHPEITT